MAPPPPLFLDNVLGGVVDGSDKVSKLQKMAFDKISSIFSVCPETGHRRGVSILFLGEGVHELLRNEAI